MHVIHCTGDVPPPEAILLAAVPQSQDKLALFHVKESDTHEQLVLVAFARVLAAGLAHTKHEAVLPVPTRIEVESHSQYPLGLHTILGREHLQESFLALLTFVEVYPEEPQTKQAPFTKMVFGSVLHNLQAFFCHELVD